MQTTFTYAVIDAGGATINVRANRGQAYAELAHWRLQHPEKRFALVLEVCPPTGPCTESTIVGFDQPNPPTGD